MCLTDGGKDNTMKIITNEKNPAVLKLLVSANVAKIQVPCSTVSLSDKKPPALFSLPLLELDSGSHLLSLNQAARFLLPPQSSCEDEVDQWLEWDSTQLQPAVVWCVTNPGKNNNRLLTLLKELDIAIGSRSTLVGSIVSVADVCVWSSLFPIAADAKLSAEWLGSVPNLKAWWSHLESKVPFQSEIRKFGAIAGSQGVQIILSACWNAPALQHTIDTVASVPVLLDPSSSGNKQKDKLQNINNASALLESGVDQLCISSTPAMSGPEWEKELQSAKLSWEGGLKVKPKKKVKPVLPVSSERNILVTSALPYVNNVPHLGNIIGCVLSGDVFARYCRLRNYNTIHICGTDEYGTATETKALEEGLAPKEICDKYHAIHSEIYSWFNIDFDLFGRTTNPEQTEIAQHLFLRLHKLGYLHTEPMEQLLCQKCDRFLADRFVEGICPKCAFDDARGDQCDKCGSLMNAVELVKPRCKLCGDTPIIRYSDQFFLDLPKIENKLSPWIEKTSGKWSHNSHEITKAWLKEGLRPRCITRDLKWGVPVPIDNFRNKVFYVWFDAPIGYMSITKKYSEKWQEWWQPNASTKVDYFMFMAKDNVPFHSIMFPSTLLAADDGYLLPTNIMATEYLKYEGGKFSKSRGTGVFGNDARDTGIPADYWRFYLLFVRPESQDSSFSWDDLALRINTELLNNLGNFVNRALMLVEKTYNSTIPEIRLRKDDITLLAFVNRELSLYIKMLESAKLRDALRHILAISRHGNQYIQSQQPWVKAKGTPDDKVDAGTVVGLAANIACLLSVLLQPYMPHTSQVMQEQMRSPENVNLITDQSVLLLPPGHKIGKPSPLFTKIETNSINEWKEKYGTKQSPPAESPNSEGVKKAQVTGTSKTVSRLQDAVDKQALLVRELKASGKPKSEWQPHVNTLLQLKADLAAAQLAVPAQSSPSEIAAKSETAGSAASEVEKLEEAIGKQANLVREMKTGGRSKEEYQPEVNKLLDLKKQLASLQPAATPGSTGQNKSTESSGSGKNKSKKKK